MRKTPPPSLAKPSKFKPATLIAARTKAGLSQRPLAEALGISQTMLSLYESGKRIPSAALVELIPKAIKTALYLEEGRAKNLEAMKAARIKHVQSLREKHLHARPSR